MNKKSSSKESLKERGYITENDLNEYRNYDRAFIEKMMYSHLSYKRTVAVRLLSEKYDIDRELCIKLCEMLREEKKLYTKLEISNVLQNLCEDKIDILVNYLGAIGNNQHKKLPEKKFMKKSYPLPRDIMARIIAHMNIRVLPHLIKVLDCNDEFKISEAVDAIGFLCFYNNGKFNEEETADAIFQFYKKYKDNRVLKWKFVRCFESFYSENIINELKEIRISDESEIIRFEAERSLSKINERYS